MKYIVLIIDGAADVPLDEAGGKTALELARTPHLDALAREGQLGMVRTVPPGMEPSSACACMSIVGYDPRRYYKGRASIEAKSLGVDIGAGECVFRCNLVTVREGRMHDYSAGHIRSEESARIIHSLNEKLGGDELAFYPGVGYRHILKIRGHEEVLEAVCTPPHDIPGRPVVDYLPQGGGSGFLRDVMARARAVLEDHPVNLARIARGELPATDIWLFWGSGRLPPMPSFTEATGLKGAMTSGVDLLRGLAGLCGMDVLDIRGVTDGADSDHAAQMQGALDALGRYDIVFVHIEAPDEAGHGGLLAAKVAAIEAVDARAVSRLRAYRGELRVLIMPDHPTPVSVRTHTDGPVPFLIWGKGVVPNGVVRFTEAEAARTGIFVADGYKMVQRLLAARLT
ncbi:MAG: cofactor-independent phosphoglycerate mutase [Dehalococcoidales bacterium]|nr:cofactor-independent phosphoglycerate mutase [Dehalococcoidales bacterium]